MATWSISRLRWVLGLSLLALIIPTMVLSWKARQQIKWEALYQQRQLAEELTQSIDNSLQRWLAVEQARPVTQYRYLVNQTQQGHTNYLQRSPLSKLPANDSPPGLIGYFQVDSNGKLETPLLPANDSDAIASGLSSLDIEQRRAISNNITAILSANQLVSQITAVDDVAEMEVKAEEVTASDQAQASFEKLTQNQRSANRSQSLGKIAELDLERGFADAELTTKAKPARKEMRKRTPALAESIATQAPAAPAPTTSSAYAYDSADAGANDGAAPAITIFSNEASPFHLAQLESGHLILFRDAWLNQQRLVQGLLLDQEAFIADSMQQVFQHSSLSQFSNLVVALQGNVLKILPAAGYQRYTLGYSSLSAQDVTGTLLLQSSLSAPLTDLELIFSANRLPEGPGGTIITWVSLVLLLLLFMVFALLYWLGVRQIRTLRQQQNFIASVSHELKTPLTSIRMFSEMLKEGWVSPEKQQEYYCFISDESDRLSRLITNVLQLARMERQELNLDIKPNSVNQLIDLLRSRLSSQVAGTDFTLNFNHDVFQDHQHLHVDPDAMMQILMNLVDNSLKFAKHADNKNIDLHIQKSGSYAVFEIRDYGPGIPDQEQSHIFELFYRVGNELTRSAQGTGIGLALVQQLVSEMGGVIEYVQPKQGAAFRIRLPLY